MSIFTEEVLFRLRGKIQNYAWGGYTFIPALIGLQPEPGMPYAEYWMGAHTKAPSEIIQSDGVIHTLDKLVAAQPEKMLGASIAQTYGRLPFLFKVLDVRDMLSIQVHPTKLEAEKGFARENELGIPLDSPLRNYKDDNHKPEVQLALSDFWLLHGFRLEKELLQVLDTVPELAIFIPAFVNGGYIDLYKQAMEMPLEQSDALLASLAKRILPQYDAGALTESSPDYWAAKALSESSSAHYDRGIFSIYFFNLVHLQPGQAQFQDAGVPHALLRGQTIEIMANSDNVIRGGLTPKQMDIPQLLKLVTFEGTASEIIEGQTGLHPFEKTYASPSKEFCLSTIQLSRGDIYTNTTQVAEILLLFQGKAIVRSAGREMLIDKGESIFICAGQAYSLEAVSGDVLWFRASTPLL